MEEQTTLTLKTKESKRPVEGLIYAPLSDNPSTVLALIERVALAPRANVEKLDGIKIVKNRPVLSESDNGKHRGTVEAFKYAPLEEIDKHLRPLLTEEEMD